MPKKPFQKLKLLYIKDYLYSSSDEEHTVTVPMIIEMLKSNGIESERKSIYNDIELLRDLYGIDIVSPKRGEYYIGEREFQLPEIKLLVDSVSSSKFLTEKKSAELIKKLEQFSSKYQAQSFSSQVFLQPRIKKMNESIYNTVDVIFSAINDNKQISFKYYHFGADKKKIYSKNDGEYVVSPFAMLIDGDNYYLVAFDANNQIIRHFRADRIEKINVLKKQRVGHDRFNKEDYKGIGSKMFSMFTGELTDVTLRFENSLASVVIDRFGKDIWFSKADEEHFDISTEIWVSRQFFGWLFGLGGVKIISPKSVAEQYKEFIKTELKKYDE